LPGGTETEAIVKWFRNDKGYGFVELPAGRGDAFLHLKTLRSLGRAALPIDAKVRVLVDEGPRGAQVTRVFNVDGASAVKSRDHSASGGPRPSRRPEHDLRSGVDLTGKVKWFDGARGFGFVAGDDFGRDVFVHCSILGPAGVSRLEEGQAVTMRVVETPKGREADDIFL
jgi:cold shock protein